jgi:hypothetical protein
MRLAFAGVLSRSRFGAERPRWDRDPVRRPGGSPPSVASPQQCGRAPGGAALDHRTVTAPTQSPAQRQKPKYHRKSANLRASQVGLSVVRGIITPFTSNAAIPPLEHNGTAMLNVRAHAVRATGRLVALVFLDVLASQTLRLLAAALHRVPAVARVAAERLDLLVGGGELGGLRLAAALVVGLFVAGAFGDGERRRNA